MQGVRAAVSPGRHDGAYPAVCNLCEKMGIDNTKVQMVKEHYDGRSHWSAMTRLRRQLQHDNTGTLLRLAMS